MAAVKGPPNVFIIGAQSTGKTTIVNALEKLLDDQTAGEQLNATIADAESNTGETSYLGGRKPADAGSTWRGSLVGEASSKPKFIREVARTVLQNLNVTRDDLTTVLSSRDRAISIQRAILQAQFQNEKAITDADPNAWYVSDRSGLDPIVYAGLFVDNSAAKGLFATPEWLELEARMKAGVVILLEAGTTWLHDDGTRHMPKDKKQWMMIHDEFRRLLQEREITFHQISHQSTILEDRVELVIAAWQKSFA